MNDENDGASAADPGRMRDSGVAGLFKRSMQAGLRAVHVTLFRRPLPRRLALYMHEIDGITAQALDELLPFFQQQGYEFVDAATYDADADPARRMAFLSFDDNYLSWYENRPLLLRHHVRAAFYVNSLPLNRDASDPVAKDYYRRLGWPSDQRPLTGRQLASLEEDGHTIGCHSHSHFNLAALDSATLSQEVLLNRTLIEAVTGKPVCDFSFPFGMPRNFPTVVEKVVRDAGFTRIAHATAGMQYATAVNGTIHRALWHPGRRLDRNLAELCVDGRLFVRLSGRSPIG